MAAHEFQFQTPSNANCAVDITKNTTIVEEGPRICPLCSSIVRKFYINFNEKIFMCTNLQCEYPFGEKFSVYSSDDDGYWLNSDLAITPRKRYTRSNRSTRSEGISSIATSTLGTNSVLSTSEWADMSRTTSQGYDSDDNSSLHSAKAFTRKISPRLREKRARKQEEDEIIKKNVEKIKEYTKALYDSKEEFDTIRNEKWIQNLSALQNSSGMRLVKENELQKLKNKQEICHGELKIDIETKPDAMSSIVIEIGNISSVGNKRFKKD